MDTVLMAFSEQQLHAKTYPEQWFSPGRLIHYRIYQTCGPELGDGVLKGAYPCLLYTSSSRIGREERVPRSGTEYDYFPVFQMAHGFSPYIRLRDLPHLNS